LVSPG
jgi:hypothetical protein